MKNDSTIYDKSSEFATHINQLYNVFCNERREFILSKLIIRSGTFVAEDIKDAKNAQSEDV
ncbi:MAG: four helix bundle protein, partial [Bacteroidales bacterium]|nr:four helix bundle protein [Bacteroidales bacterium]